MDHTIPEPRVVDLILVSGLEHFQLVLFSAEFRQVGPNHFRHSQLMAVFGPGQLLGRLLSHFCKFGPELLAPGFSHVLCGFPGISAPVITAHRSRQLPLHFFLGLA